MGKLITFADAARKFDAQNPPHPKTLKTWPGFPRGGKPNGKEWLDEAAVDAYIAKLQQQQK
jgi:hypothetical protein